MAELPDESSLRPTATYPDEPFACPHCGQMLAASVRVCPSCKEAIDPNEIVRPEVVIPVAEQVVPLRTTEHARFSWSLFFAALGSWLVIGLFAQGLLGPDKSRFVLGGVVVFSSVWVYQDAREKNIPKPLRWSLGSFLLWIIVFPWYLSRRRTPKAPCPFIEGESGRVVRTLLFILLVFFLISILIALLKRPSKPSSGGKAPDTHGVSAPAGKIAALTNCTAFQALARAPSEASQT